MSKQKKYLVEIVAALLILGLALFLRVRRLETTGIWADQALTLSTAMRWINGGAMPLAANKSSAGFMNPPMIEYLFAAALWIWPDILSVALMTMTSGMVAVAAAGWATYRVFGRRAAFWAALLFAVNPWGVLYSQQIWNQTMVPVFSSLMLGCLLLYFAPQRQRPVYLLLSFVWAACMTQVHPGTVVQLLTMGLVCALFWRRLKVWPVVAGGATFLLSYVPFLLYESAVGWTDVVAIWELARQPAPLSVASILISFDLLHAMGLLGSVGYVALFDGLATALLAFSLIYALWACGRGLLRRREPQVEQRAIGLLIVLLWFALPILSYLRSAHYLQIYYLIGQWPAHFVLIGVSLDGLQRALERRMERVGQRGRRRALRVAACGLLPLPVLLLAGWQVWFNVRYQDHRFQARSGPAQIRHVRAAIRWGRRLLAERPACDLVVVSEGHHFEASDLSLLVEFVSPERVLLADGRLALPVPAPCAVYLDALPGSRGSGWLVGTAAPLPEATISALGETWRFYELPADARAGLASGSSSGSPMAAWTNGVVLAEYARAKAGVIPGAGLPLTLTWSVDVQPSEVVYHLGTYLLTPENRVVAQSDGPGFDSIQWRAGDRFVTWFELPVPPDLEPGDYRIAVAWYTWPGLERIELIAGGNTAFLEDIRISASNGGNQNDR